MYKNLFFPLALAIVFFTACDQQPFVEHDLKFEKVSDGCTTMPESFKLNSNFGGERYEFVKCLAANFSKDQMTSVRKGDTVVVTFKRPAEAEAKAIFNIILDIDSYPRYNFLTIDEDTYRIVASAK